MNAWVSYDMTDISSVSKFMKGTISEMVEKLIEDETHEPTKVFISKIEVREKKDV